MTPTKKPSPASSSTAAYILYIVLGVVSLSTVSFTLYQQHQVTSLLGEGARANAALNIKEREAARVEAVVTRIVAAVDDAYVLHHAPEQLAASHAASHEAERELNGMLRAFRASVRDDASILIRVDGVSAQTQLVTTEAHSFYDAFERSEMEKAAAQMALMHGHYRTVERMLDEIVETFEESQDRTSAAQQIAAGRMNRTQFLIALLIMGIMVGVAVYGRLELVRRRLNTKERRLFFQERARAEEALRQSEDRFPLAAKATRDMVWDWNIVTNSCWLNEAYRDHFGYPVWGELELATWAAGIHPDDVDRVMHGVHEAIAHGADLWSGEYRFRHFNGEYSDVFDRGYVIYDDDGKPVRMVGAVSDVTQRNLAEKELRKLNAQLEELGRKNELILNAAADGIFGLDLDGKATFLNPAGAAMVGFSLEELAAAPIHSTIHHTHADGTAFPAETCPTLRVTQNGETVSVTDDLLWRKDGTSFAAEYSSTPMRADDGQIIGAVVTFRDITERRAVQRMKDEFVSLVSHELRTPLTSIRGALGLLAGGLLKTAPEKGQRMLEIAVNNTDRLVRLINDILDLERIDSGKVTLAMERCQPDLLLRESAELIRPIAEKAGIRIEVHGTSTPNVWADPDRIGQTLTNLLSNAIKFSAAATTITLSAALEVDRVVFRVADQGRGIPSEKLETIFERFQQVDASDSREKGGSGLGLAICRSIIGEHGGELVVESVVGAGSVFSFSIPVAAPHRIEPAGAARAKVIVCDDDPDVRETLQVMLEQHDYHVAQAGSGEALIQLARSFEPDVILLDLFMPDMSGWDTMGKLRGDPATAFIPVVILSGLTAEESPSPFDLAGWVSKPAGEHMLIDALQHALALAGRKPCVMVIEDDFDLARVITASFDRHGIESHHATTGREAIDRGRELTPDLLILDLGLPDLDGFAVVEWLRTQERLRNVALIVYSAADPTPEGRDRLRVGRTEFLTKSRVPPEEFERRVIQLLDAVTTKKGDLAHVA